MVITDYIWLGLASVLVGFAMFWIMILTLRKKLHSENLAQKKKILREAQQQVERIKAEANARNEEKLQVMREELETNIEDRREDLRVAEVEIESQEESATNSEQQLKKREKEIEQHQMRVQLLKEMNDEQLQKQRELLTNLRTGLEQVSGIDARGTKNTMQERMVEARQLEAQKILKMLNEDLSNSSKRHASRMLARSLSRYAPDFVWPKANNIVEVPDKKVVDQLASDQYPLISQMKEISGATIELVIPEAAHHSPSVKFVGGYGIYREAAKMAIEELIAKPVSHWSRFKEVYEKNRLSLEQQASKFGRMAVRELHLEGIHPEIQKMVGSLYWRTSYRQNQFHHSVEVAKLAGILAVELGVDPDAAKRCGLLHDIGKSIDYRIEGSHAVISGDYADRFGETRLICDAVMSHHNDLRVESPLAYVLKSADTLSGARPGARINLEEGYQIRLSAIDDVVRSFPGVTKSAIMNGGREVHIEVNHKRIREDELQSMSAAIAKRIEQEVQFPGQIKVMITRRFEAVAVA